MVLNDLNLKLILCQANVKMCILVGPRRRTKFRHVMQANITTMWLTDLKKLNQFNWVYKTVCGNNRRQCLTGRWYNDGTKQEPPGGKNSVRFPYAILPKTNNVHFQVLAWNRRFETGHYNTTQHVPNYHNGLLNKIKTPKTVIQAKQSLES